MQKWLKETGVVHEDDMEAIAQAMVRDGIDSPRRLRYVTVARLAEWTTMSAVRSGLYKDAQTHASLHDPGLTPLQPDQSVADWLCSHDLGMYSQDFIDRGLVSPESIVSALQSRSPWTFASPGHLEHGMELLYLTFSVVATQSPPPELPDDPERVRALALWLKNESIAHHLVSLGADSACRLRYVTVDMLPEDVFSVVQAEAQRHPGPTAATADMTLAEWLQAHDLEAYTERFEANMVTSLKCLGRLYLDSLRVLGIVKPVVQRQLLDMSLVTRLHEQKEALSDRAACAWMSNLTL